ncbi:MAG: ATP synthase F1 subunit delta [Eubacteriaceae bacterium]|nr:ATP synthase F1 subunit delta [Eubacteriaceae bacterium]
MAELTIDMTYGSALFSAAEDLDKVDDIEAECESVLEIFKAEPEFYQLINDPALSAAEKKTMLTNVFKGRITGAMLNFLYILVDKGRTRHYEKIVKVYKSLKNKKEGFAYGIVYSVQPLEREQIEKLQRETGELIKSKVKLDNETDRSLIGGVKILINGKIIDASLKKRLEDMRSVVKA